MFIDALLHPNEIHKQVFFVSSALFLLFIVSSVFFFFCSYFPLNIFFLYRPPHFVILYSVSFEQNGL